MELMELDSTINTWYSRYHQSSGVNYADNPLRTSYAIACSGRTPEHYQPGWDSAQGIRVSRALHNLRLALSNRNTTNWTEDQYLAIIPPILRGKTIVGLRTPGADLVRLNSHLIGYVILMPISEEGHSVRVGIPYHVRHSNVDLAQANGPYLRYLKATFGSCMLIRLDCLTNNGYKKTSNMAQRNWYIKGIAATADCIVNSPRRTPFEGPDYVPFGADFNAFEDRPNMPASRVHGDATDIHFQVQSAQSFMTEFLRSLHSNLINQHFLRFRDPSRADVPLADDDD
jgi:hypothetical protein